MSFTSCPLCDGVSLRLKYSIDQHHIIECSTCSLMWLSPQPTVDDLLKVYDNNYFSNKNFLRGETEYIYGYSDYAAERYNKQSNYVPIAKKLFELLFSQTNSKPRLLDVGCGLGYFLDVAHDQGFEVNGLEFNSSALQQLQSKYVFPTWCDDFVLFKSEKYDAITMFDVIEHFKNPFLSIKKAHSILNHNGYLVITTMDCGSIISKILGTRLEDFRRVREHLFFFTRKSISKLLMQNGFEVVDIKYHGHTFNLSFFVSRLTLSFPFIGKCFSLLIKVLRLGNFHIHVNPLTKMIIYAKKVSV